MLKHVQQLKYAHKISTVAGYHVMLAELLLVFASDRFAIVIFEPDPLTAFVIYKSPSLNALLIIHTHYLYTHHHTG